MLMIPQGAAAKFVAHMDSNPILHYTDSLYDIDTFRRTFGHVCIPDTSVKSTSIPKSKTSQQSKVKDSNEEEEGRLSKRDVTVLLKWLMRDMGVVVTDGTVRRLFARASVELAADSVNRLLRCLSQIKPLLTTPLLR